jgi:hypothetical protein
VRRAFLLSIGALAALLLMHGAQAATIDGADVRFTYDDTTLFGVASVNGNSIFFQPTNFKVQSTDGSPATVLLPETLNVTVEVLETSPGYVLEEFQMFEQGDYKVKGDDAWVQADGQFRVTSDSNSKFCPSGFFGLCEDKEFFDTGQLTTTGGTLTDWSTGASIDLADTTGWGTDTKVTVTLENLLTAQTANSLELAFIEKKFEGVGIIVNPTVPIPGAVWLFGSAIGLLGWMRRRSN